MAQNNTNEHKTREVIAYGVQDLETGRIIGRLHMQDAKRFEKRLRKDKNTIITFALIVGLGLGAVSGVVGKGFIEDRQEAKQIAYEQQVEERKEVAAARESTYTIDYTIGYGQTISGIVYSYQSDPNIAENLIDEVAYNNDLSHPSLIQAGHTYKFHDVPESALRNPEFMYETGYTVDYDVLDPEIEVQDRIAWTSDYLEDNKIVDEADQIADTMAQDKLDYLVTRYQYAQNLDGEARTNEMNNIRLELRELDAQIEEYLSVYVDATKKEFGREVPTVGIYFGKFHAPRVYQVPNAWMLQYEAEMEAQRSLG